MVNAAHGQQAPQLHRLELHKNQLQALNAVLQTVIATGAAKQSNGAALATPFCLTVARLAKTLLAKNSSAALYLVGSTVGQVLAGNTDKQPKDIDLVLMLGPEGNEGAPTEFSKQIDGLVKVLQKLGLSLPTGCSQVRSIASNKGLIKITNEYQNKQGHTPIDLLVQAHDAPFEYDELGNSRRIKLGWKNELNAHCEAEWPHDLIQAMQKARLLWFNPNMNQDALYRALMGILKAHKHTDGKYWLVQTKILQEFCSNLFEGVVQEKKRYEQERANSTQANLNIREQPYLYAAMRMVLSILDGTYFDLFFQEDVRPRIKVYFDQMYKLAHTLLSNMQPKEGGVNWSEVSYTNTEKYFPSKQDRQEKIEKGIWVSHLQSAGPFGRNATAARQEFMATKDDSFEFILKFSEDLEGIVKALDEGNKARIVANANQILNALSSLHQVQASVHAEDKSHEAAQLAAQLNLELLDTLGPDVLWGFIQNNPGLAQSPFIEQLLRIVCTNETGRQALKQYLCANPGFLKPSFAVELLGNGQDGFAMLLDVLGELYKKHGSKGKPQEQDKSAGQNLKPWLEYFLQTGFNCRNSLENRDWTTFFNFINQWLGCLNAMGMAVQGVFASFEQSVGKSKTIDANSQNTLHKFFSTAEMSFMPASLPAWVKTLCCFTNKTWVFSDWDASYTLSSLAPDVYELVYKHLKAPQDHKASVGAIEKRFVILDKRVSCFEYHQEQNSDNGSFKNEQGVGVELRSSETGLVTARCYFTDYFSPSLSFQKQSSLHCFSYIQVFVELVNTLKALGAKLDRSCPWVVALQKKIFEKKNAPNNGLVLGIGDKYCKFYGFMGLASNDFPVALGWRYIQKNTTTVKQVGFFMRVNPKHYTDDLQKEFKASGFSIHGLPEVWVPHGFLVSLPTNAAPRREFFILGGQPENVLGVSTKQPGEVLWPIEPAMQVPYDEIQQGKTLQLQPQTKEAKLWQQLVFPPLLFSNAPKFFKHAEGWRTEYNDVCSSEAGLPAAAKTWQGFSIIAHVPKLQTNKTLLVRGLVFTVQTGGMFFDVRHMGASSCQVVLYHQDKQFSFKFNPKQNFFLTTREAACAKILEQTELHGALKIITNISKRVHASARIKSNGYKQMTGGLAITAAYVFMVYYLVSALKSYMGVHGQVLGRRQI